MLRIQDLKNRRPGAASETTPVTKLGDEINRCLESEEYGKAYEHLKLLTRDGCEQSIPHVLAGLVAVKLDLPEEAATHFEHALAINPGDFDAGYNLALLELAAGERTAALRRLRRLSRRHPDNAGLHNDMAVIWLDQGRFGRAQVGFRKALSIDPNFSKARNNALEYFLANSLIDRADKFLAGHQDDSRLNEVSRAEISRWRQKLVRAPEKAVAASSTDETGPLTVPVVHAGSRIGRIAFFAAQPTFVNDIVSSLSAENETRFFDGDSIQQMADMMEWADLAWFEWCDDTVIQAARLPKKCRIVCRLHSYEAFTDMPRRVDWSKVDHLLFVNESVRSLVRPQVKNLPPSTVIHNGVDLERFRTPRDKRYGKKIASVGYINYKKNPALLLYCFKKIHEYDPEYTFHIAGTHQDPRIALYFSHFLDKIKLPISFDGWIEDMPAWYADKDYVISTSLFESFHYSIAEGMASGLMPLIHNWYGAENLYPDRYLYNDPDDCLRLLTNLETADRARLAAGNREHIRSRFDQKDKMDEIRDLLSRLVQSGKTVGEA
ncbi:MAG: tetratricopeptide repeat protein [Candidatus Zixiibacteriota bacterium]|nr:MAG: tetratricopeptide repeat protein [candidate division Zixibacteria bacterium]